MEMTPQELFLLAVTSLCVVCFFVGYLTGAGRMAGRLGYRPTLWEKFKTLWINFGRPWSL